MGTVMVVLPRVLWYALIRPGPVADTGNLTVTPEDDEVRVCQRVLAGAVDFALVPAGIYPYISETYRPLTCGAIIGHGTGGWWMGPAPARTETKSGLFLGFPHRWSTAYLAARMWQDRFWPVFHPLHELRHEVHIGRVHGMVLDQPYPALVLRPGLQLVENLGRRWSQETDLPYPMYLVVARRDMDPDAVGPVRQTLQAAVRDLLEHRDQWPARLRDAVPQQDPRAILPDLAATLTPDALELGATGRQAFSTFFTLAFERGLVPEHRALDWA